MSNPLKIKNRWPFTKKMANSNGATPSLHMQTDTQSAKWYHHITELPLNRFIDVVVDGNFSALIITGYPAIEELKAAWSDIQGEYADAMGDHEHRMYISLFKEVSVLAITLQMINSLVEVMEAVYHPKIAAMLNQLLVTNFQFNQSDPEKYQATLKRCKMRSRGIKIDLELKQVQLVNMQGKETEQGQKPSREYFQAILITISDHAKYPIMDSISVYEYCARVRRYNYYCEQVKMQAYGRRTH